MYVLYILRCADRSLYTGITNDLERRFAAHRAGKGGRYTRAHKPRAVVYQEPCGTKSAALKRELAVKRLTRAQKLELIIKFRNEQHARATGNRPS